MGFILNSTVHKGTVLKSTLPTVKSTETSLVEQDEI